MQETIERLVSLRRAATLLVGLAAAALLVPGPAPAQAPPSSAGAGDPFDGVRATIRQAMAERGLASVSVAAAAEGRVVWEESFGWADREGRVEATPHTPYSLASISKPITATGLMVLVERGAVDLDRPVGAYLGRAELAGHGGDASAATVRRVLAHTAGLPLHYQFFYDDGGYGPPPREETIRRYAFVAHPPGTEFQYSNLGYGVLDHVVSRVSGKAYADFLRAEVFLPLGMTRSSVGLPPALAAHAAVRYDGDGRPIPFYDFDHPGASAVWASAHDLVRFGLFHLGHRPEGATRRILRPETVEAMRRRETPAGETAYGLGWFVGEEHGFRKIWHTGSMPGVSTMLALYPELDVAVVVLLNGLARDLRVSLGQEIVAALDESYGRVRRAARERAGQRTERADDEESEGEGFSPLRALVGHWAGVLRTWEEEIPMEVTVAADGDVHVLVGDQLPAVLAGARFVSRRLQGRYAGRIPTADVMRHPLHSVFLDLRLDGDRLHGQASARTEAAPTFFSLASYVELTRREP